MKEIKNAKIETTMLGFEDHSIMTCFITLNYGGSSQGYGGYVLDGKHDDYKTNYGIRFVMGILETVGVEKWEELKGKHVRAEIGDDGKIERIGHIIEDKWFSNDQLL